MTTNSTVSSNAFNYLDFLKGNVDPRTGQYTLSLDLPELKANALSGPDVLLMLDYSPLNPYDSGYGLGWNLRLSQYTPHNSMLSLHTGESFKVTGSNGNELLFQEKKLNTFRFLQIDSQTWRIVHKNGLVEILELGGSLDRSVALPTAIYAASGHGISLEYEGFQGGQRLARIRDPQGELLRIERHASEVRLLLPPFDNQPLNRYLMKLTGGRVMEIVLPVAEQASWRFTYTEIRGTTCIKSVKTPLGAHETLDYLDEGHRYPGKNPPPNLPRVTHHQIDSGPGAAPMKLRYDYSEHNFLGFGTAIDWISEGLDQLYKYDSDYEYTTTIDHLVDDTVASTMKRFYNRFHLQTKECVTRGQCIRSSIVTYHDEDTKFELQPPYFQLPKSVETRWELGNDSTVVRSETEYSEFDLEGNPTLEIRSDGVTTETRYYNKDGEDGYPGDPNGFVRHVKETIVTPPADAPGDAPTLVTRYRYSAHAPLAGAPLENWLSVSDEFLYEVRGDQEVLLNHTQRSYYETPDDPHLHGRNLQQVERLGGTCNTLDFVYAIVRDQVLDEDCLQHSEHFTGFDDLTRTLTHHESLAHGQTLMTYDENDVQVRYSYDSLHRLTGETVAPNTEFAASRSYEHVLVARDEQRASVIVTDVKQVRARTCFDGLGRAVLSEIDSGDGWKAVSSATYDALGQLCEETSHDWLGSHQVSLTTRYEYDDWGQVCRTTLPDGVVLVSERSPFGEGGDLLCTRKESSDQPPVVSERSQVQYNRYDKVDWSERRDGEDNVVGRQAFIYNGYGECIRNDEEVAGETRTTLFEYDARRRVARTQLPGGAWVERCFAEHSRSELPTAIRVVPGNTQKPTVLLGEQTFDSLERLTSVTVGPRVEHYRYQGHKSRVSERTTPANNLIQYFYENSLGELPKEIVTPEGTATYRFDKEDAGIDSASNAAGDREYLYDANGHLQLERWTDADGSTHETRYTTSLLGRPLQRNDDRVFTLYKYDTLGRLEQLTQARLQADFAYDSSGRQHLTTTRDLDSGDVLVSENHYDSLGRICQRTLQLNDSPLRTLCHVWGDDDQLSSRHYQMDGRSLLMENFVYDFRGRLEQHTCSGERLPSDRYGNAIVDQLFRFDDLDNIELCLTTFANGDSNRARFTYAEDDSCQLVEVSNTYLEGGYPQTQAFEYDLDGNLLNDEQGQQLRYDSQGRLLEVSSADGSRSLVHYRYDGHQHLVGARQEDEEAETLRFYQGYRLSYTVRDGVQVHYFSDGERALGQQQIGDHQRTLLLLTDASPSVIAESLAGSLRQATYSAYGEQQDDLRLDSLMGFNGELREPGNGWYLLGRGYRAYNPSLMRFHSPDSLSPFEEGGLNCYMYGLGNPVRFSDPSGHKPNPDNPEGYRVRGTDEDVRYVPLPKPPERKKSWMDWLPVAGMVVGLILTAAFVPWSAPALSAGFIIGMGAMATTVAGVGAAVVGTVTEDAQLMSIANMLTMVGSVMSMGAGSLARAAATKAKEKALRLVQEGTVKAVMQSTIVPTAIHKLPSLINISKSLPQSKSLLKTVISSVRSLRGGKTAGASPGKTNPVAQRARPSSLKANSASTNGPADSSIPMPGMTPQVSSPVQPVNRAGPLVQGADAGMSKGSTPASAKMPHLSWLLTR